MLTQCTKLHYVVIGNTYQVVQDWRCEDFVPGGQSTGTEFWSYVKGRDGRACVIAHAGYSWDGESIPWWIPASTNDQTIVPSLGHDLGYQILGRIQHQSQHMRRLVDDWYKQALVDRNAWFAHQRWQGVRIGGKPSWDKRARRKTQIAA